MDKMFLVLSDSVKTVNIIFFVFDILIVLTAFAFLIWLYIKTQKVNLKVKAKENEKQVKKIDDETYVLLSGKGVNKKEKVIKEEKSESKLDNLNKPKVVKPIKTKNVKIKTKK